MLYRAFKRAFDFCCALLAIVITSPIWLVAAVGIKLSSRGPVFYRAERAGVGGRAFIMYKFRSMHVFEPSLSGGPKTEGGFIANEQRIFPLGRFLRKSKIDELPQFINILLGQMSVVGPRPITVAGVQKHYTGEYACITDVRPGLACLDSIYDYAHGELFVNSNEEYARKILPVRTELAKIYVQERGIGMDIGIIFRTARLILQIAFVKKKEFSYTKYEKRAMENVAARMAAFE